MSRILLALPLALTTGCLMAGNYHSARTLEKGTGAIGMTFSITRYTDVDVDETTGERSESSIVLPSWLPEFTYHLGVTDDLELGGRVAAGSLGLEGDLKYRLLHTDSLHLAIGPSLGYQGAILYDATYLKLPLIATMDLADNFSVTVGAFAGTADFNDANSEFDVFNGTLASTGAFVGIELRTETLLVRPGFEWTEYVADFDDSPEFDGFRTFSVIAHFAILTGTEKKQLNRMERKMDRIIDNQEGRPHPPNEPPPTDDSPYPPPMK
jgi:hypothetical protein